MIAGTHDEQRIAERSMDEPTVTGLLLQLQEAGIAQGKAITRGDRVSAEAQHSKGLLIIDQIRTMVGEQPMPRLNPVSE